MDTRSWQFELCWGFGQWGTRWRQKTQTRPPRRRIDAAIRAGQPAFLGFCGTILHPEPQRLDVMFCGTILHPEPQRLDVMFCGAPLIREPQRLDVKLCCSVEPLSSEMLSHSGLSTVDCQNEIASVIVWQLGKYLNLKLGVLNSQSAIRLSLPPTCLPPRPPACLLTETHSPTSTQAHTGTHKHRRKHKQKQKPTHKRAHSYTHKHMRL